MEETELLSLVLRAQKGDRTAFDEIVLEMQDSVFAIVLRRLRNRSEALEVTQDVFIQVLRKISQLREPERFAGWLRRIAVRMAINRAVRRPREILGETEALGSVRSVQASPLERILRNEKARELRDGLTKLRELDRKTLVAFYLEGQSLQEMSDQFNSPVGTIKRRLHTARNRLRDQMAKLQPVG